MVWMNPSGPPQSSGLLPPMQPGGAPAVIDTFGGRLWLFKSGGQVIQFLAASNEPVQDVPIGQPPILQSPVPEAAAMQLREKRGLDSPGADPDPGPRRAAHGPRRGDRDRRRADRGRRVSPHPQRRARPRRRAAAALVGAAGALTRRSGPITSHRPASSSTASGSWAARAKASSAVPATTRRDTPPVAGWKSATLYRGGPITPENRPVVGHYTQMIWRGHDGGRLRRRPRPQRRRDRRQLRAVWKPHRPGSRTASIRRRFTGRRNTPPYREARGVRYLARLVKLLRPLSAVPLLVAAARLLADESRAAGEDRLQPRRAADPVGQLLQVPRLRREDARRRPAARHARRRAGGQSTACARSCRASSRRATCTCASTRPTRTS